MRITFEVTLERISHPFSVDVLMINSLNLSNVSAILFLAENCIIVHFENPIRYLAVESGI